MKINQTQTYHKLLINSKIRFGDSAKTSDSGLFSNLPKKVSQQTPAPIPSSKLQDSPIKRRLCVAVTHPRLKKLCAGVSLVLGGSMVKSRVFWGMGDLTPLMTESLQWVYKPLVWSWWVYPLLYGNNGSLDPGTCFFGVEKLGAFLGPLKS